MNTKMMILIVSMMLLIVISGCFPETIRDITHETAAGEELQNEAMSEVSSEDIVIEEMTEQEMEEKSSEIEKIILDRHEGACEDWKSFEIKDVDGESFRICDFNKTPVLIESFAVWCPTCKKQQDAINKLHDDLGDSFVSIALDTDPNEDERTVRAYKNQFKYTWRFAVSPVELTKALIDEFGVGVVNAPGAPIILVCEDQSARMLPRGLKSAEKLKNEIEKGC